MNVDSAFNCGTGMFGVWSSAVTVSGTKTLNIQHYSGSDMASLTHYDTVNVFGGEIPAGFSEKNPAHSMNVYDYSGVLGLTLTDFDAFTASGTSNVSLISTVSTIVRLPNGLSGRWSKNCRKRVFWQSGCCRKKPCSTAAAICVLTL